MLHMQSVYMQVVIIQLVFSDHTYHTVLRKAYNLNSYKPTRFAALILTPSHVFNFGLTSR